MPRILVVDDDRLIVHTLTDILAMQGWEVSQAYDGESAIRALRDQPFDVVLMDVKMPGMNGVEAFKAMKRDRPAVKVVLMTAYAANELIAEAERESALRVMSKPVDVPSLLAYLTSALSGSRPVLIIDSDAAFLRTLSDVLRLQGFDTVLAGSLHEALARLRDVRPAAVLLHMHMSSTSPRQAVLAVHDVSDAAVILYSGQPDADRAINGDVPRELVHAYLRKPFAVSEVTRVLDDVVRR